jgi:hypothetical protein
VQQMAAAAVRRVQVQQAYNNFNLYQRQGASDHMVWTVPVADLPPKYEDIFSAENQTEAGRVNPGGEPRPTSSPPPPGRVNPGGESRPTSSSPPPPAGRVNPGGEYMPTSSPPPPPPPGRVDPGGEYMPTSSPPPPPPY